MMPFMDAEQKLNLGCGTEIKKGWVNLDSVALAGVDVVHDIEKLPLRPYRVAADHLGIKRALLRLQSPCRALCQSLVPCAVALRINHALPPLPRREHDHHAREVADDTPPRTG